VRLSAPSSPPTRPLPSHPCRFLALNPKSCASSHSGNGCGHLSAGFHRERNYQRLELDYADTCTRILENLVPSLASCGRSRLLGRVSLALWPDWILFNETPANPDPEHGWTVPLQWTHTTYGAPEENAQLLRLHFWFVPFFVVLGVGETIRKLHEKNEPWRKR